MGRSRIKIDPKRVEDLATVGVPVKDMAIILGCCESTIKNNYKKERNAGLAKMRLSVRRKLLQVALEGNVPVLIFLGKSLCGLRDKDPFTGPYIPVDQRPALGDEIKAMDATVLPPHLMYKNKPAPTTVENVEAV
jgi:hypothetical protein